MKRSLLLIPALVCLPLLAEAQAPTAGETLFREAVELFKAGKVPAACAKLDESFKLEPTTQTLFSLAKCREREGKTATAWAHFSDLVERHQKKGETDKATQMQARVTELGPKVPRVTLKLENHPDVGTVSVDGRSIGHGAWGSSLPLDPGEHVVLITRSGKPNVERKLYLKEGDNVPVELERTAAPVTPPPVTNEQTPPPEAPIEEPPRRDEGHKTLGYILGGVGVAGIAAGSIFGVIAIGQKSDADDKFANRDPSFKDSDDSASTSALVSTILFGVGIAGLAAGAYFVLTSPSRSGLARAFNRVERGALLW